MITTLESALQALGRGTPEENAASLAKLKRALESSPASEAIAAIRQFLDSGKDAATGLPFKVGPGGALDSASSMRVFLLDELAALAKASGDASSSLYAAQQVLATPEGSADEWAVAMRNVAWADKSSGAYLNGKFRELISQPQWQQNPSVGMMQAFDIPVFTHDVSSIPLLASYLQAPDPAYKSPLSPFTRAAAVALDRLAQQAPLEVMNYLNSNPGTMADAPLLRADYFSKADLSNAAQKAALETYFSRSDVGAAEKSKTVQGLVCPGTFVSDNLLTVSSPPADPDASTPALEKAAKNWATRFPTVSSELTALLIQDHAN